jgi:hypothetical protein
MKPNIRLRAFSATKFATANVKDFEVFGFREVWIHLN